MYKKIGVILLALILMFNFTFKDYAEAAIASKVASQAAKQVAQEVIQDIAVETATNFALKQAMEIAGKYEAKQGYKIVCPDGSANCDKPIQIKETITDSDKQAIKGQAGTELDKLLNGGAGVSKWQKFLDWFLPVWLISFGATALTYAFDSDVRSLFNEAGYNALVALGLIVPVTTNEIEPIEDVETPPAGEDKEGKPVDILKQNIWQSQNPTSYSSSSTTILPTSWQNLVVNVDFTNQSSTSVSEYSFNLGSNNSKLFGFQSSGDSMTLIAGNNATYYGNTYQPEFTIMENGVVVKTSKLTYLSNGTYYSTPPESTVSILKKQMKSIQYRAPYEIDGFWYTDVLYNTVDGNTVQTQSKATSRVAEVSTIRQYLNITGTEKFVAVATVHENIIPNKKILPPVYSEQSASELPIASSNYEDDKNNVALIPPSALTYKEESTGETVYRVPAAVPTNPPVFQKEDGTPVPEEGITVGPAPTVTPAPNGSTTEKGEPIPQGTPTVTPAPTPSNPAPAPIPLTPAPSPTTPVEPPTNGEPPTTGEPIPDGPGCEEKFKFPILSPLKETFSTAFPFSIPWDIERAINAAFSGIGHEKPKFNLDLNVLGQKETIEITTPKMFDDWKPFTDTLLVLTFDVLIMFGVYRFVKGAGS